MQLLLIEDDATLADGLQLALSRETYQVTHAATGEAAEANLRSYAFDLVILDLGLPDMEGVTILRGLRQRGEAVPVLVLTAREGVEQQVAALDAGADDYMEKPFDLRELMARVRALLRRRQSDYRDEISIGAITLNPKDQHLQTPSGPMELPAREYEVLEALMLNSPRVVHKQRLAQRLAMSGDDIGDNAVEVYIHRLRRRLAPLGVSIRTLRGVGYLIEAA
jgi:two-component system OmpR family response regulator